MIGWSSCHIESNDLGKVSLFALLTEWIKNVVGQSFHIDGQVHKRKLLQIILSTKFVNFIMRNTKYSNDRFNYSATAGGISTSTARTNFFFFVSRVSIWWHTKIDTYFMV